MNLLLPPKIVSKLENALVYACTKEIGGILMGEHVGINTFRVKELTIQRKKGTFATFVRLVEEIIGPLRSFFQTTNHNYTKFNYLGEWHSHHSFALRPSSRDNATMLEIVMDEQLGARFVVLLLVKLNSDNHLDHSATVYQLDGRSVLCQIMHVKLE
ncbi:MAG: Mov34/MPN/PAD-1 family protein [Smithella sp.]|jgi:hypothetical protein